MKQKVSGAPVACSAEIGSVTQAMRVQEILAKSAIPTKLIKTESSSRRGCIYGISYSCAQENNVYAVLEASGVSLKRINKRFNI